MYIFNMFNNKKSTKEPKEYDVENQYIKSKDDNKKDLIIKHELTYIRIDELLGNFEKQL